MAFDFKKEFKELYAPKNKPSIVKVPRINYLAVRGSGDPNVEDGEYKQSIGLLYGVAYAIKMSKKSTHHIEGYFDFVVPPLEGFWWQEDTQGVDYAHKENSSGFQLFDYPTLLPKKILIGPLLKQLRKRS